MRTLVFITLLLNLTFQPHVVASTLTEDCKVRAETAKVLKMAYDKGLPKSQFLLVYQGSDEWNRSVRDIIHAIYRGDTDNVTASQLYDAVYSICLN
ncbi:hypothetical protein NVP2044O_42 [Vibrio phage 2.044.O._10N.261.51.B8]|nr:hypothetical protein NVP2044O_42 [Vibrio phage 2.044.O._10N.261.51.B8]